MSETYQQLSDDLAEVLNAVQAQHADINPVIGVNRQMRTAGIPVDLFTIDCLKTNKRILLMLHDQQPDSLQYQYGFRDQDPGDTFEVIALSDVSIERLTEWVVAYFSADL